MSALFLFHAQCARHVRCVILTSNVLRRTNIQNFILDNGLVFEYKTSGIRPSVAPPDAGICIRRPLYKSGLCFYQGEKQ